MNHDYKTPAQGANDWHIPLNDNFERLDTDVEIRGNEAALGDYEPKDGAKFLAVDTGSVYIGTGISWNEIGSLRSGSTGSGDGAATSSDMWTSVASFGAVGDGRADDTQALQDAVQTGDPIWLPSGTYRITEPIQIAHNGQSRLLAGTATSIKKDGTVIRFEGDADSGIGVFEMPDGTTEAPAIKNIHVDVNRNADFGIRMGTPDGNVTEAVLDGVTVTDAAVDGIHLVRPIVTSIRDCSVYGSGRDGFHVVGGGTSVVFMTNYAQACGRHGYYLSQLNYSSFVNCASDDNAGTGYSIDNRSARKGISFYSCGAENNGEQGYYVGGMYGVVMSGCVDDAVSNSSPIVEFAACDGVVVLGYWTYNDPSNAPAVRWTNDHDGVGSISTYPTYSTFIGCSFPSADVASSVSQISSRIGSRRGTVFQDM